MEQSILALGVWNLSTFKLVGSHIGARRVLVSPPNKQKTKESRISVKPSMTCNYQKN